MTGVLLKDSKLYAMSQISPLFTGLIPGLGVKMAIEAVLEDQHPREEGDTATRIFCQYVNADSDNMTFMVKSTGSVETSTFAIDQFLEGYGEKLEGLQLPVDPVQQIEFIALEAITYAASLLLDIEDLGRDQQAAKDLASEFLGAFVATVYGDPLDVFMIITEVKDGEEGEDTGMTELVIRSMWIVKGRGDTGFIEG